MKSVSWLFSLILVLLAGLNTGSFNYDLLTSSTQFSVSAFEIPFDSSEPTTDEDNSPDYFLAKSFDTDATKTCSSQLVTEPYGNNAEPLLYSAIRAPPQHS
jgi:hypothetical protein